MRSHRQEYWNGLPFLSLGDFPDPGIKPTSPALTGGFFTTEPPGKSLCSGILYGKKNQPSSSTRKKKKKKRRKFKHCQVKEASLKRLHTV